MAVAATGAFSAAAAAAAAAVAGAAGAISVEFWQANDAAICKLINFQILFFHITDKNVFF